METTVHLDFLTLACLADELRDLVGARIQNVVQPHAAAVGLELYAGERRYLLIDASPQNATIRFVSEKPRSGVEAATPLGLLLRKYVREGRLIGVHHPPWERIIELAISHPEGNSTLVAEIMGRRSNLLLLDPTRTIRECVLRADASQNRYRVTLPNHPYESPPPFDKAAPPDFSAADWRAWLAAAPEQRLAKRLVRDFAAVSPTLARELAWRSSDGRPSPISADGDAATLHGAVNALFGPLQSGAWSPHLARDAQGQPVAFAPYPLQSWPRAAPTASISAAMAAVDQTRLASDGYATARRRVGQLLDGARARTARRLAQLRDQVVDEGEIQRLRQNGELLLAYQWQIKPRDAATTVWDHEGAERMITLDPDLSAVENAQRYFARYDKKKRAAAEVPPRIAQAEQDIAFLEALATDLAQAEQRPEIDAVREALAEAGFVRPAKRRGGGVVRGPRRFEVEGFVVLVGRNAKQNDEITFRQAAGDDLWLHARGVPGSHVILKRAGREPSERAIERAAAWAAYYSQARGSNEVSVDITERRFVQRLSGARPGLVTYRHERTVRVAPRA